MQEGNFNPCFGLVDELNLKVVRAAYKMKFDKNYHFILLNIPDSHLPYLEMEHKTVN